MNQLVYGFKDCNRMLPDGGMLQVVELEVVNVDEVLYSYTVKVFELVYDEVIWTNRTSVADNQYSL